MAASLGRSRALISFDIEEWFHVLDSEFVPAEDTWDQLPGRAAEQVRRVLDVLDQRAAQSTFFVLGWFASRHPDLIREICARGHEVASHSNRHPLLYQLTPAMAREELRTGRDILEQITGEAVLGFRAPGFSITHRNPWALDCIAEVGFRYDSSLFPARRSHGGMPGVRAEPHVLLTPSGAAMAEVPVSTFPVLGVNIPFGGGGYLRLAPLFLTRYLAHSVIRRGRPFVSYVHPRDLDLNTPRLPLGRWRSFKCYVGLAGMRRKLSRILLDFGSVRFDRYLQEAGLLCL